MNPKVIENNIENNIKKIKKSTKKDVKKLKGTSKTLSIISDSDSEKEIKISKTKNNKPDISFIDNLPEQKVQNQSTDEESSNDELKTIIDNQDKIKSNITNNINELTLSEPVLKSKKLLLLYKLNPISHYEQYFSILKTNNKKIQTFINIFKKAFSENCINELYLKEIINVVSYYKITIGYLIKIKNIDHRTDAEIQDIFNIIKTMIYRNTEFLENLGYVTSKKNFISIQDIESINTSDTYHDKNPIWYKFIDINELKMFTYEVNNEMFDYIRQHYIVNIKDIIEDIYISWYLMFLHLILSKNIQSPTIDKKIQDKFLTLSTDTNPIIKNEINFLKRKTKKIVVSKADKINNIVLNDSLNKIDIIQEISYDMTSQPSTSKFLSSHNLNLDNDDDDDDDHLSTA